jgi:HSP20 family protein
VYETETDIVIKMCIPGVRSDEVAVEVNGEVVTVCGVRKGAGPETVVKYHQMEIRNGYFERRIILRLPFDPAGARGEYRDGFAYIYIPKAAEAVRHVVTIRLNL